MARGRTQRPGLLSAPGLTRRRCLQWSVCSVAAGAGLMPGAASAQARPPVISAARAPEPPLRFPQDAGAHLDVRAEWWNLKGLLQAPGQPALGFHMAFFRTTVESAAQNTSRFAPRHVLGARASLSDPSHDQGWHDLRMARLGFGLAELDESDMRITLQDWTLGRRGSAGRPELVAHVSAPDFTLDLRCAPTQAVMLHGENGTIHRDPFLGYPTRYYSLPQLQVTGQVNGPVSGQRRTLEVTGRAWLDHGWGRRMMAPDAVGADWVCINLNDGSALMVFQMRRTDGSPVWEGATWRRPGAPDRVFKHDEIHMVPGQVWRSPATGASYPVAWRIELAGTSYTVKARMHQQEVDGGNGIGDVYWEGLCDLLDGQGRALGAGYLEMTGYAGELIG